MRRIVAAYSINEVGTWIGFVALAVGVYDHTHDAVAVAGLFVASRLIPAGLVPALVARVEASHRRGALSGLYITEAALAGLLALFLFRFSLPALLLLAAADGTAALAASALLRASVAKIGADQALSASASDREAHARDVETARRRANGQLNIAWSVTNAAGPALAGVLVAAVGGPVSMLVDAASFVVCGALLVGLRPTAPATDRDVSIRSRLRAAFVYVRQSPALQQILVTEAAALAFFASAAPVEVIFAKATLHAGDVGFGVLTATWGLGMVLGGAVFSKGIRLPLGWLLTGGTVAVAAAYLGFAAAPSLAVACIPAVVGGAGNGSQWAALITSVQQLTPDDLHGRLMSAVESIGAICPSIGFVLGGVLASATSPRIAFVVAGGGAAVLTAAFVRVGRLRPTLAPAPQVRLRIDTTGS